MQMQTAIIYGVYYGIHDRGDWVRKSAARGVIIQQQKIEMFCLQPSIQERTKAARQKHIKHDNSTTGYVNENEMYSVADTQ